ncbi:MAG: phosphatase PAP2 family protein [Salibacteraceae bacterium]
MAGSAFALSYAFDASIERETSTWIASRATLRNLSEGITIGGGFPLVLGVPTLLYVYGSWRQRPKMRRHGLILGQCVGHSLISSYLFKALTGRSRPTLTSNAQEWQFLPRSWSDLIEDPSGPKRAFPSAHSAMAWSMASYMTRSYQNKKWVGATCYSLAGIVALSRVTQGEHWASDVVIGSLLGYGIGRFSYWVNRRTDHLRMVPWKRKKETSSKF